MSDFHCRQAWEAFLDALRKKATPIIRKYFHDPEEQQDVLAELVLRFAIKALNNHGAEGRGQIGPLGHLFLNNVENTIIDIDRSINGRKRLPADIRKHPPLERTIYHRYYMQRTAPEAIIEEICNTRDVPRSHVLKILKKMDQEMGEKARRRSHGSRRRQEIYLRPSEEAAAAGRQGSPEAELIAGERLELVMMALDQLGAEDRLIMQCYYLDELKISEIAELMHLQRYRVTYRMLRGRKLILNYLRSKGLHYEDLVE